MIDKSLYWMQTAVKKEWLVQDLPSRLVAVRGFSNWEKRDEQGIVFSQEIGDYVLAQYELRGYVISLQESGASLSVRVVLPRAVDLKDDPEGFVRKWIGTLINLPPEELNRQIYQLHQADAVYCGQVASVMEDHTTYSSSGEMVSSRLWWQLFDVCTDGGFFALSLRELDGSPMNPQAQPGLPDRF